MYRTAALLCFGSRRNYFAAYLFYYFCRLLPYWGYRCWLLSLFSQNTMFSSTQATEHRPSLFLLCAIFWVACYLSGSTRQSSKFASWTKLHSGKFITTSTRSCRSKIRAESLMRCIKLPLSHPLDLLRGEGGVGFIKLSSQQIWWDRLSGTRTCVKEGNWFPELWAFKAALSRKSRPKQRTNWKDQTNWKSCTKPCH